MKTQFLLLITISLVQVQAQPYRIVGGKVVDATSGQPLAGAIVTMVDHVGKGDHTDAECWFMFILPTLF